MSEPSITPSGRKRVPLDDADLTLEQIVVKVNSLPRRSIKDAIEVGELLIRAQRQLEGTGETFEAFCKKNFDHAISTLWRSAPTHNEQSCW